MSNVEEQIGELLARLQSPDFFEREEAVKQLGSFTEDEAVAGLVLAMEDPDLGIRELAANQLAGKKGQVASQLLIRFLANDDIGTRNLASEVLVKIGAEAVPALAEYIECDDHDVRKFICDVLGLIGDDQALEALNKRLYDENGNVVCSAAEALGEIGKPDSVEPLIAIASKVDDVRLSALEALGKIGHSSALEHLYTYLDSDDPIVFYVACEAIGKIGFPESVQQLSELLKSQDRSQAEAALSAIIEISVQQGGKINIDLPLDEFSEFLFDGIKSGNQAITEFTLSRLGHWFGNNVVNGLLDVMDYVDDERLERITEVLGDVGQVTAKPIVAKLLNASKSLKLKLLEVVKQYADEEIGKELVQFTHDEDAEVRQKVAHILGVSGYQGAVGDLKRLAEDPNGHVRAAAFSALGWLCSDEDVEFIFKGLDDKYSDVREATVGALVIIGDARVVSKFTADLYHEDAERQRLAVTALGWIGEQDVVEPLLKAINHPDPAVRKSAIASLTRIGNAGDLGPIVVALNDENSGVRKVAVSALASMRGAEAINDIRFLLDDDDVWVRYHAMTVIGDMGQAEFADSIIPYLNDEMDVIKIAATKALAQMGSKSALPMLTELTRDNNQDLAKAAQKAVSRIGSNE